MITDFRKSSTISDGIINVSPGDCDTDNVIIVRTVISAIVKITVKKKSDKNSNNDSDCIINYNNTNDYKKRCRSSLKVNVRIDQICKDNSNYNSKIKNSNSNNYSFSNNQLNSMSTNVWRKLENISFILFYFILFPLLELLQLSH